VRDFLLSLQMEVEFVPPVISQYLSSIVVTRGFPREEQPENLLTDSF
jgi:hypothetical protein